MIKNEYDILIGTAEVLMRRRKRLCSENLMDTLNFQYNQKHRHHKMVSEQKNESFVILDDEDFDYKKAGFFGRAVKTCFL